MTLAQAKDECERWLAYLHRQEIRSIAIQSLAADRRAGRCDGTEAKRRLAYIDKSVTVYDGAKLATAVRVLIKEIK
jgi:hypothetical protein